jgi:RNA-splicing ligase RtcB
LRTGFGLCYDCPLFEVLAAATEETAFRKARFFTSPKQLMKTSKNLISASRLAKALASHGIVYERVGNIVHVQSTRPDRETGVRAEILLPPSLPLEAKAVRQLLDFAGVYHPNHGHGGAVCKACATPDFHPGSPVPVGSILVTSHDFVVPQAVGTDINCGMRLHVLDLTLEQFLAKKAQLVNLLKGDLLTASRNVPTTPQAMTALFNHGLGAFWQAMHAAAHYADANRTLVLELVRQRVRQVYGDMAMPLVCDVPHNIVLSEAGGNVHRKGATPAHAGQPLLIPGSMGDASYLLDGLGHPRFAASASHGAGRAVSRMEMSWKAKQVLAASQSSLPFECITLKQERLIEEAPGAYKPIGPVIQAQVEEGLVQPIARLTPLLTFKA